MSMSQSRPVWGAWIEILIPGLISSSGLWSRPVWGAWIEIYTSSETESAAIVAPRMGRVD